MAYEFKVRPHREEPGVEMVEVWRDGVFVAGIYPRPDGLRVFSKFMTDSVFNDRYPASIDIHLRG